ncbi:hypothetical protein [Spirosoma radiotolerans]|uniref:Uncharacterized protein n=1 Tax=Spirosoma radiotolerans TaxID=1379870 RepID=A0A0E3ZXI3_9BACT|nr:hypothetical protein [Spirosoma radiotolerans]AKD56434.1 hypothetical protein SD10_17470 [Spirosoma radiotolerans]
MTALPNHTANQLQTINTTFNTLTEWAEATASLHENYTRLMACISQNKPEKKTRATSSGRLYIGQCPVDQIITLLKIMQEQMGRLVADMEQINYPAQPVRAENYKKLATHTRIINKLNQQAQTKLWLTTLLPA